MGNRNLIPVPAVGDWHAVRRAFEKLNFVLGIDSTPTFSDVTVSDDLTVTDDLTVGGSFTLTGTLTLDGLTANRLVATNASKELVSSDLINWVTGTTNRITVTDDGDGTITLTGPQDLHAGASPTFNDLTLSSPSNIYALSHDSFADFVANEHIDWTSTSEDLLTSGTGTFDTINISSPSTNGYYLGDCTISNALAIVNETSGTPARIDMFAADGDGTDNVQFRLWLKGTKDDIATSSEYLQILAHNSGYYGIFSKVVGTGSVRPIIIDAVGSGGNQIYLSTDGKVGINTNTLSYQLDVNGTFRAQDSSRFEGDNFFVGYVWIDDVNALYLNDTSTYLYDDGTDLLIGADGLIKFLPNSETDDYITMYAASNVVYLGMDADTTLIKLVSGQVTIGGSSTAGLTVEGTLSVDAKLRFSDNDNFTISGGVVSSPNKSYVRLDPETGTTDDVDTIGGGPTGFLMLVQNDENGDTVTYKDGTGNLNLNGDCVLSNADQKILLFYDGLTWGEVVRPINSGGDYVVNSLITGVSSAVFTVESDGDTFWTGDGSGLPFGCMYTNTTIAVTISDNNPTEVYDATSDGFTAGELNEVTFPTGGDEHYLVVGKAGRYLIEWTISCAQNTPSAAIVLEGGIMLNGSAQNPGRGSRAVSNSSDVGNMGGTAILDLAASDQVSLYITNETNTTNIDVEHATLTLVEIGGT